MRADDLKQEDLKQQTQIAETVIKTTEAAVNNPEATKQVANNMDISNAERKQLLKVADNPNKMSQMAEEVGQKAISGDIDEEKPELKSKFMDALGYFLPSIIGGAIGYAAEGARGAKFGIDTGLKVGKDYHDYKLKQKQIESKTGMSEYQKKALELREKGIGLQEQQETRRNRQLEEIQLPTVELNMAKFGLSKEKAAQLSDNQVTSFKQLDSVLQQVDRLAQLKSKVKTGIVEGRVQNVAAAFGMASEDFVKLRSQTSDSLAKYVQSISGAQVSEAEAQRLGAIIPTINDDDNVFVYKLSEFRRILEMNRDELAKAIKSGQPLKKLKGLGNKKTRMTDAQRKRMLELKKKYNR